MLAWDFSLSFDTMKGCTKGTNIYETEKSVKNGPWGAHMARFYETIRKQKAGGGVISDLSRSFESNEPRCSLQSKRGRVSSVWLRGKEPLKKSKTDKYELMVSNGVHLIYYTPPPPPHKSRYSSNRLWTWHYWLLGGGRRKKRKVYTDSRRIVCSFSGTDSGISDETRVPASVTAQKLKQIPRRYPRHF